MQACYDRAVIHISKDENASNPAAARPPFFFKLNETRLPAPQLKTEVQQMHAGMIRWCRAHFGEAFSAWMHVKLIKSYCESVMRYGLPVDFSAFMLAPKKGQEAKVHYI